MAIAADRIRILIVDDHALFRVGIANILTREREFDVVGEAAEGRSALEMAGMTSPNIVLMDLSLPGMDGWEATRQLKADERTRNIPVVALTGHALAGASEGARRARLHAIDDAIASLLASRTALSRDLTAQRRDAAE